jgi:alpha-L-arabinofuranosidase
MKGAWGYPNTDGLGLLEYCLWAEDLGLELVLGVYAGLSLSGTDIVPEDQLGPFVQEALDEIEV